MPIEPEWDPNHSHPGEMYTPEGRIKMMGQFARRLKDHRSTAYSRSMARIGWWFAAAAVAIIVIAAIITI